MEILRELLKIFICPRCKGPVDAADSGDALVCPACRLLYEIRDGILVMLEEEAKPLDSCGAGKP